MVPGSNTKYNIHAVSVYSQILNSICHCTVKRAKIIKKRLGLSHIFFKSWKSKSKCHQKFKHSVNYTEILHPVSNPGPQDVRHRQNPGAATQRIGVLAQFTNAALDPKQVFLKSHSWPFFVYFCTFHKTQFKYKFIKA